MSLVETAKKLLDFNSSDTDKVLLLYDNSTKDIKDAFLKVKAINVIDVDTYERPFTEFPEDVRKACLVHDLIICLISKKDTQETSELKNFRAPLAHIRQQHDHVRVASLLDVNSLVFEEIFSYDPKDVENINSKLYSEITKQKESVVKITTPAGTHLSINISTNLIWINQDANMSVPNNTHSLLAGEVYGCPDSVNGVAVIDGVLGGIFQKFGVLKDTPLKVEIENSRVYSVSCENKELEELFESYINSVENGNRIGELGFGTNTSLSQFYGVIGIDEKFPGNHIAFGDSYSKKTGAKWKSDIHIDGVMKTCSTWINDVQVLKDGKYFI